MIAQRRRSSETNNITQRADSRKRSERLRERKRDKKGEQGGEKESVRGRAADRRGKQRDRREQRDGRMIAHQTEKTAGSNRSCLEDGWNDKPKVWQEQRRGTSWMMENVPTFSLFPKTPCKPPTVADRCMYLRLSAESVGKGSQCITGHNKLY